jgi:Na+-transporting NADH:ubiquinone oxidoreductase subunit NqrB
LLKSNFNFLWLKQSANISQLNPNINFLSDVIAFEAAVVAIAIPLSFEIISRISERYQSQVITKKFNQEWEIKALPFIFIINIILAVGLNFFFSDHPTSSLWKFAAWLVLILFLLASIIFCIFIPKLHRYITNTEFLLHNIFVDAEKLFKLNQQVNLNNKELVLRQAEFIQALEGIGDN